MAKAFRNLIRSKLSDKKCFGKTCRFEPPTPSKFLSSFNESKPLSCLFNAILWSINLRHKKYDDGYVQGQSSAQAENIIMVPESWEQLITQDQSTTNSLHLTVHRITGSKKTITLLHPLGVGISYNDV